MWNEEDRKWLYETMSRSGVDTGSYEEFAKSLNNKEDRDWYYNKSLSMGLNVGSAEDFDGMMIQPEPEQTAEDGVGALTGDEGVLNGAKKYKKVSDQPVTLRPSVAANMTEEQRAAAEAAAEDIKGGENGYTFAADELEADVPGMVSQKPATPKKTRHQEIVESDKPMFQKAAELAFVKDNGKLSPLGQFAQKMGDLALGEGRVRMDKIFSEEGPIKLTARQENALKSGMPWQAVVVDPIFYKDNGKLTPVGAFSQSAADVIAGAAVPIVDWIRFVGEKHPGFDLPGMEKYREKVLSISDTGFDKINVIREERKNLDDDFATKTATLLPQVGAYVLSFLTGNPQFATAAVATQTVSTMGHSALDAKEAGASGAQIFVAAILDGAIEFLSEKIPLGRWLGKIPNPLAKTVVSETAEKALQKEGNMLLSEVRKELGDKFTVKTIKEFAKDALAEGGSEAVAEFAQTFTPLIYNPDKYPTINALLGEAYDNARDGFVGGLLMSAMLSPTANYAQRKANDNRRREQGYVEAALVKDEKDNVSVVELIGKSEDGKYMAMRDNKVFPVEKSDIVEKQRFSYEDYRNAKVFAMRAEGYNETDANTVNGNTIALASKAVDDAKAGVRAALNLGEDADVDAMIAGKEFEGEAKDAVDTYLEKKAKFEGMRDKMNAAKESELAEADKSVDAVAHKNGDVYSGNIYRTTLANTGEAIFITGGTVVLDSEGFIDVNQSEDLVALMPNGKKEAIQAGNIRDKVTVENVEAQKAAKRAEIDARYKNQFNTFVYSDSEGDHTVMLVGRRGDMVDALIDGKPTEVPAKEFEAIMADATGKQPVVEGGEVKAEGVEPVVEGQSAVAVEAPSRREVYDTNGDLASVVFERDGKVVEEEIYADGRITERRQYNDDGEVSQIVRYHEDGSTTVDINLGAKSKPETKERKTMQDVAETVLEKSKQKQKKTLRERIRESAAKGRIKEWEKRTGVSVRVVESIDEVTNKDALKALKAGQIVKGWIDGNEVVIYLPNIESVEEVDKTYIHEVVAHKGLKILMGKDFDKLCDKVWEMMSEEQRREYLAYIGANLENPTQQQMRDAADEYMAHLAESVELTETEKGIWQKIVDAIKEFLLGEGVKLTDKDIENLIKASYSRLTENGGVDGGNGDFRARKVFHGSGAQFDKFDHSFMGTGEGAQAFGWGTYVTEVEGIGKQYAKATGKPRLAYKGEMVDSEDFNNPWRIIKDLYNDHRGRLRDMRAAAERYSSLVEEDNAEMKELWANVLEKLNEARAGDLKIVEGRNLYTVEIPDDNGSNYLHWDKRIPMNVVNSIKTRLFDVLAEGDYKGVEKELKRELDDVFKADNNDGNLIYGSISAYLGGDKAASEFLNEMGFVGISYPANAMTGGRKDGARNYVIFNEGDAQIESRTMFRIAKTNEKFNEQLGDLTEENADAVELSLGTPSPILKAAGVKDMPMKLYGNKVIKKMKKHGFKLEELKDLPMAVADPIAVFNNRDEDGNRAILTELKTADGNFLVTIDLGDGTDIDFNIVLSVFGKSDNKIVNWFNKGFATYINKEKALDYLHLSAPIAEASDKPELSSAANIINNFENPSVESENSATGQEIRFRKANKNQEVFVSNAKKAVEEIKQEKATPEMKESVMEGQTMFRFIGKKGAENLDKAEEATTRLDNLNVAREMETAGKDAKAIKLATGWERGADGKWRYETEDGNVILKDVKEATVKKKIKALEDEAAEDKRVAREKLFALRHATDSYLAEMREKYNVAEGEETDYMTEDEIKHIQELTAKEVAHAEEREAAFVEYEKKHRELEALLDYVYTKNATGTVINTTRLSHILEGEAAEELFKAYPDLKDMQIEFVSGGLRDNAYAAHVKENGAEKIVIDVKKTKEADLASVLMHEIQHSIQDREGFAKGGNVAAAATYLNLPLRHQAAYDIVAKMENPTIESLGEYVKRDDISISDKVAVKKLLFSIEDGRVSFDDVLKATKNPYEVYKSLAGEVEARNAQKRMGYTMEQRRNELATETEDVSRKDQIFIFDNLGVSAMAKKKTAPETAVQQNTGHSTVVSSADGTKVLKDLDSTIEEYKNKTSNRQKTFIGDLSRALKLRNNGNNSNYGTFTTVNGETMEIRVSDHNVSTKNMADAGKLDGISIVVTHKPNKGIKNDGDAHIVEFYYNTQKLQKELGQPYVEILKSVKQALYSGEYKDNTGLAEVQEVNSLNEQEERTLFKKELSPEEKAKQQALRENAKAIRKLHNVTSRYPITALRNLGFALETQEQREMHDRLFAERDAITGESMPAGLQTNPQAMTLQERITESLLKLAEKEKENVEMRLSAIRAYGRDLANVIKLMNAQKGYDKNTVRMFTDLVKMYLRNNAMSGMSGYDVMRLLNLMQRATGGNAKMVNQAAVKIAEIITKEHTRQLKEIMEKQMKTGAEKVNASGVVVQGGVDIIGKRILNTYKSAIELTEEKDFEQKYNDAFKKVGEIQKQIEQNGSNKTLENQLKEAQAEADAMLLAATYRNEVKAAEVDITKLKGELTGKRTKAERGEITWNEYHEFAKTINSQIVQLRAQQIDAYQKVLHALSGDIYEGVQRARAFREAEAMRVQRIHDMAENDMGGVSKSAERKEPGVAGKAVDMVVYKNPGVRLVMNGLGTYENYMKYFGHDHLDGRGELFNHFITAFTEAQNKEWKESQNDFNILEAAARDIFGKKRIGKTYMSIARDSNKGSGVILKYWNGGATVERELTIGQLMYLYMTEKQTEGQMKLRNMGLTEEKVKAAVEQLPAKYKQFADFIQSKFLPQMRPRMNEVHQRMFGASMSEVENYFPLKVNKDARQSNDDINNTSDAIPSTITGSVIKRRVNVTPIDLMENAFDVLNEHIVEMEHWAAYAEFIRDNNTLINDKDFKNRVKNTKSVRYGDGETLWKNFVETARIATGNYKAKHDYLTKLMRGANAAKITFGYYTALKQLASAPAFWSDAKIWDAVWYSVNPMGSWKWAMENLPGFEERVKSRTAGNERLGGDEYSIHDSRIIKAARNLGMAPNAFVDAVVVASGARAVYKDRLNFYKKLGMTDYEANRRAKNDAAISYNETQQSGQGAYLSTLQREGGLGALLTTLFRNSQMAFQRRVVGSMVEIGKKLARGEKIREATKQKYINMGMSEEAAGKQANWDFYKAYAKDFTNLAIFGYGMNFVWALMGELPYLLFGDDEEEKEKIWEIASKMGVTGMFEGFSIGNFAKGLYEKHITDGKYAVGLLEAPFEGDLQVVLERFEKDGALAGITQLATFMVEMNTGISPQRLIDDVAAVIDISNGDLDGATEGLLFAIRVLKAPQSQQDKLLLDETEGASSEEVKKIAERYINYKMKRNFPLGSEDEKRVDKYANKFVETLKERVEKDYDPEDISVIFDQSSDTEKEILKKKWVEEMDKRNGTNAAKSLRKEKIEELLGSPVEKAAQKALHKYSKTNPYEEMETFEDVERLYEYKVLLDMFQEDYDKLRKGEEVPPEEWEKAAKHYELYKDKSFKEVINAIATHKKLIKKNDNPERRMSEVRRLTDIAIEVMKRYE